MVRLPFKTNLVFRIGPKLLAQNFCAIFGPIVLVTPIKSVCPLTSKNKNLTVRNVTSAFNINDYSVIECLLFTCYQPTYLPTYVLSHSRGHLRRRFRGFNCSFNQTFLSRNLRISFHR